MNKVYLLAGGGVDTALLLYAAAMGMVPTRAPLDEIKMLHIDYGQKAASGERSAMWTIIESMKSVWPDLKVGMATLSDDTVKLMNPGSLMFGGQGTAFLHGRNINLTLMAANHAMLRYTTDDTIEIWFGLVQEKMMFADADGDWISVTKEMVERSYGYLGADTAENRENPRVTVRAPMLEIPAPPDNLHNHRDFTGPISKLDLLTQVAHGLMHKVGYHKAMGMLFTIPFTCWTPTPDNQECGECYHCQKRDNLAADVDHIISKDRVA